MTQAPSSLASLKRYLEAGFVHSDFEETQKLVLEFGAPYVGIKRPKGFRLGPKKQCFCNAAGAIVSVDKEFSRSVTYVEGFAMCPGMLPLHHAWLALDGKEAVELTIRCDPREITYFGVSFSRDELFNFLKENMTYGIFLDPPRPGLLDLLNSRSLDRGLLNDRVSD